MYHVAPCSDHVPGYVQKYDELASKGIKEIYIIAVNDIFVVNAWKKQLAEGSKIHFLSDSTGKLTYLARADLGYNGIMQS